MAGVTDADLKPAEGRGQAMLASEPRATAARYEPATRRVVIDLVNGCSYAFPAALVQDLQGASNDDLAMDDARAGSHRRAKNFSGKGRGCAREWSEGGRPRNAARG